MYDYNRRNRQRRFLYRQAVIQAKSRPCTDCGVEYPYYVMDLDHVTGIKKFNVSQATTHASSLAVLMEEIAKCEAVCANCHRLRTFRD